MNVSSVGVSVPTFPTYQFHAGEDGMLRGRPRACHEFLTRILALTEVVPRDEHEQYIAQQCEKGAKIKYDVLPISDHITGVVFSIPSALQALGQLYNGTLDTSKCGAPSLKAKVVTPDSEQATQIMGEDAVKRLQSLNGKKTPAGTISWR